MLDTTRRGLMGGLLAMMASSAFATPGVPDKYREILRLKMAVSDKHDALLKAGMPVKERAVAIGPEIDAFARYALDHFPDPNLLADQREYLAQIKQVFEQARVIRALDRQGKAVFEQEQLIRVAEVAVPIALMLDMIRYEQLPLHPRMHPGFRLLCLRYENALMTV